MRARANKAPRAVLILAVSLVAFALLNTILLSVISDPPLAKAIERGVRVVITCLLAYFLWRGSQWARWISIVINGLAAIGSLLGFAAMPENAPVFFRAWMVVLGLFYFVVTLLLLYSKSITGYFSRRHN